MSARNYEDIDGLSPLRHDLTPSVSPMGSSLPESDPSTDLQQVADASDWHIPWSRITLGRELGEGAYGVVYKAEYAGLAIAAKKLKGSIAPEAVKEEFEHEVATLKKLRHPNIILFMGITQDDEHNMYILSEFGDNGSLNTFLARNSDTLSWTSKTSYVTEICLALAYLHDNGCLHRDLKAENVLLNRVGVCKVADFGLAGTFLGRASVEKPEALGSLWWRAPEMEDPDVQHSGKIDIFSLGITVAEIIANGRGGDDLRLEGTVQHPCNKLKWIYESHRLIPMLSGFNPPYALIEMVVRCGQADPALRPSIEELVEAAKALHSVVRRIEHALAHTAPSMAALGFELFAPQLRWGHLKTFAVPKQAAYDALSKRLQARTGTGLNEEGFSFMDIDGPVKETQLSEQALIAFLAWYEPLEQLLMADSILPLFQTGLIIGFCSKAASESKLLESPIGAIVVRFSSRAGNLAITYRKNGSEISHALVKITADSVVSGTKLYQTFGEMLKDKPQYQFAWPAQPLSKWDSIHAQIAAKIKKSPSQSLDYEQDMSEQGAQSLAAHFKHLY